MADPTPQLVARVDTAPGGAPAARLRAAFTIQSRQGGGAWSDVVSALSPTAGFVGAGTTVSTTSGEALTPGILYRESASALSYTIDGTRHATSPSTARAGGWCYFTVDPTGPLAPKVTLGAPYSACTANDCTPRGGPGIAGAFTFEPADGDSGVVAYEYAIAGSWSAPIAGATVHVDIAPPASGTNVLQVRAQDVVGRWGSTTIVDFNVATAAGAVGTWHFADGRPGDGSTTASDTASGPGERHPALLGGTDADWSERGRLGDGDGALALGGDGYASTDGPVVDTNASFTVSAWVFAGGLAQDRTALSQTAGDGSGFGLGYSATAGTWQFTRTGVVGAERHTDAVTARAPAAAGVWTHLGGTYDAGAHTLVLYVDGRAQGESDAVAETQDGVVAAGGDLEFGRTAGGFGTDDAPWKGSLDEVDVWGRALSADDMLRDETAVDADGAAATANVAAWDPAGASGTTLADGSGYGRILTTQDGAVLDGTSLVLGKENSSAVTAGPVVDPGGSFTVTARVLPDADAVAALPGGSMVQVLRQGPDDGSGWGIWSRVLRVEVYDPETDEIVTVPALNWMFGRLAADGTFSGVSSQDLEVLDGSEPVVPRQITGVRDAQDGTVELYVDGNSQGRDTVADEVAAGPLAVGRSSGESTDARSLPGRVEDVRLWAGAMSASAVAAGVTP